MRWFILAVFIMAIIVFGIAAGVAAVDALGLIIARFGYVGGFGALVLHITLVGFAFPPTMYFVLWLFGWLLDRISAKPAHDRPITSERLGSFQGLSAREMEMWSNKAELEAALRAAGLGEWASRLAALARHSIIFVPCSIEDGAAAPIGASRLGGQPDLPPDVDWPARPPVDVEGTTGPVPGGLLFGPRHWLRRLFRTQDWKRVSQQWEGTRQAVSDVRNRAWPLSFVAQIDFAEVNAVHALDGFPSAGRLLLFAILTTGRGGQQRIRRGSASSSPRCRPSACSGGALHRSSTSLRHAK